MSNPSFENIEQWFFEYTEGNLSPSQEQQFKLFLEENPALLEELEVWKSARIAPAAFEMPAALQLTKPTPLFYRPGVLAALAILLLFLSWVGFLYFPSDPIYTASSIDANIIYVGDGNRNSYFDQLITQSTPKNDEHLTDQIATINNNTEAFSSSKHTSKTIHSTKNNNQPYNEIQHLQSNTLSNKDNHTYHQTSTSTLTTLNGNGAISASLPIKVSTVVAPISQKNEYTLLAKKYVTAPQVNKVHVAIKKLKRMLSQPSALRRTHRPNYQVPMMTAFKAIPALAGDGVQNRLDITSRYQWGKQTSAQLLNTVSWDGYLKALHGGIGIDANYDAYNLNKINNYSVGITYSPKISLGENFRIEPGIRYKMGVVDLNNVDALIGKNIELNRNNLLPFYTGNQTVSGDKLWYKDVGVSLVLNTKWFYIGANMDNISRHYNNFYSSDLTKSYRSNIQYTAVIGTEYRPINYNFKVDGYLFYQKNGNLNELWAGGNFQYKWMQIGAGVSTNLDAGGSIGLIFKRVGIHYNIDYTESRLQHQKFLSHQLSIRLLLGDSRQRNSLSNF